MYPLPPFYVSGDIEGASCAIYFACHAYCEEQKKAPLKQCMYLR